MLFFSKNLLEKETKEEEQNAEKGGGRLLGQGHMLGTKRVFNKIYRKV